MTTIETAWLAGLLEGEGHFGEISTGAALCPQVKIDMVDRDIIERVARFFGTKVHTKKPPRPENQPQWRAKVRGRGAIAIMLAVLPFLGLRRAARVGQILAKYGQGKRITDLADRLPKAQFAAPDRKTP